MNVCEITRLSQYAARRLQPGTTGTVHSAYEKSVNLRVPDGLVCVQAAGTAQSPLTLAAWLSPAALAALALEPGMDMTVRGSMLCFGNGVQLSFARAERTAHTLRPLLQPERLAELQAALELALTRADGRGLAVPEEIQRGIYYLPINISFIEDSATDFLQKLEEDVRGN